MNARPLGSDATAFERYLATVGASPQSIASTQIPH